MATYRHSASADIPAERLFRFLSQPENLPRYIPEMTAAEPRGGDEMRVEAEVDGRHVAGKAWVHADEANRTLSWGTDGDDDYHGELSVTGAAPNRSEVSVVLHTTRHEGEEVQRELERTVAALTRTAAARADEEETGPGEGRTP
jgi:uncharacterized protein YndB with AHSA1/START domain